MRRSFAALLLAPALTACVASRPPTLPLPAAAPGTATSPALRSLEAELRAIIATDAPHDSLEVAVALLDLASGDSLLIDGHTRMHAASTMKVPVMLELFRQAERGGTPLDAPVEIRNRFRSIADGSEYRLDAGADSDSALYELVGQRLPLRELVRRMIDRSSNLATNLLIERADPERIETTLADVGASAMTVLRGVEDGPAYERGMNNTTTAHGLARALRAVAEGRGVSPSAAAEMLAILEGQQFREMIPAGLPPGARVGNKTGWITAINHDGAIVLPPGRAPYVLVVLTRGFHDRALAAQVARRVSRRVWMEMTG